MRKAWFMALVATLAMGVNAAETAKTKLGKWSEAWQIPVNYTQEFLAEHPEEITVKLDGNTGIPIDLENAVPGKYCRVSLQVKGVGDKLSVRGVQSNPELPKFSIWSDNYNIFPEWRQMYFYNNPSALKNCTRWQLRFEGKGEVALKDIKVEQLDQADLSKNLLPDNGLNPACWTGRWGKIEIIPQMVEVCDSPFGSKAIKAEAAKDKMHLSTIDLPAIPGAELVAEFWIKADTADGLECQATNGLFGKGMQLGLNSEWQKFNYSATIPDNIGEKSSFWFMFFNHKQNTPLIYYIAKFDVHYVFSNKTK